MKKADGSPSIEECCPCNCEWSMVNSCIVMGEFAHWSHGLYFTVVLACVDHVGAWWSWRGGGTYPWSPPIAPPGAKCNANVPATNTRDAKPLWRLNWISCHQWKHPTNMPAVENCRIWGVENVNMLETTHLQLVDIPWYVPHVRIYKLQSYPIILAKNQPWMEVS
jgi:hypothetical protein